MYTYIYVCCARVCVSVHVYVHVCVHFVQQFFQDGARVVCVSILCSSFTRTVLALRLPSASISIVLIRNKKETVWKSSSAMPMLYDTSFVGKWL